MLSGISRASGSRSESGSLDGGLALWSRELEGQGQHTLVCTPRVHHFFSQAQVFISLYRASTEVVLRNGTTTPTEALVWVPVQRQR